MEDLINILYKYYILESRIDLSANVVDRNEFEYNISKYLMLCDVYYNGYSLGKYYYIIYMLYIM